MSFKSQISFLTRGAVALKALGWLLFKATSAGRERGLEGRRHKGRGPNQPSSLVSVLAPLVWSMVWNPGKVTEHVQGGRCINADERGLGCGSGWVLSDGSLLNHSWLVVASTRGKNIKVWVIHCISFLNCCRNPYLIPSHNHLQTIFRTYQMDSWFLHSQDTFHGSLSDFSLYLTAMICLCEALCSRVLHSYFCAILTLFFLNQERPFSVYSQMNVFLFCVNAKRWKYITMLIGIIGRVLLCGRRIPCRLLSAHCRSDADISLAVPSYMGVCVCVCVWGGVPWGPNHLAEQSM